MVQVILAKSSQKKFNITWQAYLNQQFTSQATNTLWLQAWLNSNHLKCL